MLKLTTVVCLSLSFSISFASNNCQALFSPKESFSSMMPVRYNDSSIPAELRSANPDVIRGYALNRLLNHYQINDNLYLTADSPIYERGLTEIKNVYLTIHSGQDIQSLANILSQGRDSSWIVRVITENLKKNEVANIPLVELLPVFARSYTHRKPICENSNCFNAAINWHNPKIGEAYTTYEQLTNTLSENYRRIMPGEKLKFGDMIVFRNHNSWEQGRIKHTAIFIDQTLVWHKGSISKTESWTFAPLEAVLYRWDRGLREPIEIQFYRYAPSPPTLLQRIWPWNR